MRHHAWAWIGAAAGVFLLAGGLAAQDIGYGDIQRRLAALENELALMRQPQPRLASSYMVPPPEEPRADEPAAGEADGNCCVPECGPAAVVGPDFLDTGCRRCGIVFGSELILLKPVASNGDLPGSSFNVTFASILPPVINFNVHNNFNFETTPRFWLGYVTNSGLGFRVQYWEFRQSTSGSFLDGIDLVQVGGAMRFRTFDWEVTQQVSYRKWRMLAFGGFRYGEVRQSEFFHVLGPTFSFDQSKAFNGIGLTGGANLYRSLFNLQGLSWYTNTRGSVLFGDRSYNYNAGVDILFPVTATTNVKVSGDTLGILEIGTGPQWQMPLARGGQFFVRGGFEGQLWLNSGTIDNTPLDGSLGNVGFGGFSIAAGILR
ncbi:MAG: hypothetical protein HYX69_03210 [Planctomycetia bacterium]|nr:hypothetical protein [Planctomycetia bacterium]